MSTKPKDEPIKDKANPKVSSDQNGLNDPSAPDGVNFEANPEVSSDQNGLDDTLVPDESLEPENSVENSEVSSDQNGLDDSLDPGDAKKRKIAIVIPYLKNKAQGHELLLALRSIEKNFAENCQVIIIGDKEEWFSDEIKFIDKPCIGNNPQADVIEKVKTILLDESIPEEFIWSNDDIYFVGNTTLEDLKILKSDGMLHDIQSNSLYNSNRLRTINALKRIGKPTVNFATHMPVVYEKEKMIEIFEVFQKELSEGMLLSSAYFNFHFPDEKTEAVNWRNDKLCLRVISQLVSKEKKELFRQLIIQKKFLNHSESGYSELLMDWLFRQFPVKSRFEK